jgi:ribosomal protein L11 methyltransferase
MPEKSWRKIIIRTPPDSAETVAARLVALTGQGTEINDPADRRSPATVIGYLPDDHPELPEKLRAIAAFLEKLNTAQPGISRSELIIESIPEEDWDRKWREGFKPFHLSRRFVIKPSWEDYQNEPGEMVIEIDPGQAFGTGLHASTRLIVELLERLLPTLPAPPAAVLDVGTGTGILAICAARLGCGLVTGIDIDPAAVNAARQNIAANYLDDRIGIDTIALADLKGPYDLILANIIHNTLVEMADNLAGLLAPGGLLMMAGILRGGQAENIKTRYAARGLTCLSLLESGEWAALCLRQG